jgi:hypothetical protein
MRDLERLLELAPECDPLAPRRVATTAFPKKRLIVVLRSDAKSDRYALHRFPDGSVSWRADTFTAPEHPADPELWIAYGGELSVAQVIELVPDQRRAVLEWTRAEITSGVHVAGVDDMLVAERREHSLNSLREQLAAASDAASRPAA